MESNDVKKIFISYSWTTPKHEKWVLDLAERLVSDGVDVVLDKWNLKPGEDKYSFMERMVTDVNINKVLIICDSKYKEKADGRNGGVGTETQIITPELYTKVNQRKYIPIIAEYGEDFDSYIPTYAKSLIGIDLANAADFEKNYEELLRDIYDKPRYVKPKLGKTPSFLLEDESKVLKAITFKNREIKNHITNGRKDLVLLSLEDLNQLFFDQLDKYKLNLEDLKEPIYSIPMQYISEMKYFRDEFITTLISLTNFLTEEELSEYIIEFLEELYGYHDYKGESTYNDYCLMHYRFTIHELFIWINMILLKYKKFNVVRKLTHIKYVLNDRFERDIDKNTFERFYYDGKQFEIVNKNEGHNKYSFSAHLMQQRGSLNEKDYTEDLVNCDLILHYISMLKEESQYWYWFPLMYIYKKTRVIKLFLRSDTDNEINKVIQIFAVKDKEELKNRIKERYTDWKPYRYTGSFYQVENITEYLKLD
ncbi:toll/interleukin-1 receptor domain-containing protein [Clostridium perfringens]|uniref:toll/interleukin-1 receptor domain-containing protein n=1 Tax=Clostridium perfringens TaxID=1502 RepID=UPI003CE80460